MLKRHLFPGLFTLLIAAGSVHADHAWGPYHWARLSNPFNLVVINSTTPEWDPYVSQALYDWSNGSTSGQTVALSEDQEGSTSSRVRRQCKAPSGMVRICNLAYGATGWLGIAGISVDANGHIVRGYTKLNDSYFSSGFYDQPDWKQSVTCQELGHDIGLSHQDEDFNNESLASCMDYQNPPFEQPNQHDFDQLDGVYDHPDEYSTIAGMDSGVEEGGGGGTCKAPKGKGCNKSDLPQSNRDIGWGVSLGRRGHSETFMRVDPNGMRHLTHVVWADQGEVDDH